MMTVLAKWKITLYLTAIFCAGAVSGWVVSAKTAKQKVVTLPRPDDFAAPYREQVHSKVPLTPDQEKQVDGVIDRSSKEMQSINGDWSKRIRQCRSERAAQISALLTPEQRTQFEKMEKERQDTWRGHEPWRGKGPPHDWRRGPRERSKTNNVSKEIFQTHVPSTDSKPEK